MSGYCPNLNSSTGLTLSTYRKLQEAIISKAVEYNVPVVFVDPRNISLACSRCRSRTRYVGRLSMCPNCRFIVDRDVVSAMNLVRKYLIDVGHMSFAPKGATTPRETACNHDEAWRRGTTHPSKTHNDLGRETVTSYLLLELLKDISG